MITTFFILLVYLYRILSFYKRKLRISATISNPLSFNERPFK